MYGVIYVESKKEYKWTIQMQNRNRAIDIENKPVVISGKKKGGKGKL